MSSSASQCLSERCRALSRARAKGRKGIEALSLRAVLRTGSRRRRGLPLQFPTLRRRRIQQTVRGCWTALRWFYNGIPSASAATSLVRL